MILINVCEKHYLEWVSQYSMITHYLHGQWNMLNLSVSVSVSVSLSPLNPTRLLKTDGERRCRREKKRKEEAKEIEDDDGAEAIDQNRNWK